MGGLPNLVSSITIIKERYFKSMQETLNAFKDVSGSQITIEPFSVSSPWLEFKTLICLLTFLHN